MKHDIQDLIDEGKVSFDPTPTNPLLTSNIIQNPLSNHQTSKEVNMTCLANTQFNPSSSITKILEPKKVIFLPDSNHVSTINVYFPKPIPPLEHEHLLTRMWDMALESPITVLPPCVNMYEEGSTTYDPSAPHIIYPHHYMPSSSIYHLLTKSLISPTY